MAERHHSQEQLLVSSRTTQYQVLFLVMPQAPREIGTGRRIGGGGGWDRGSPPGAEMKMRYPDRWNPILKSESNERGRMRVEGVHEWKIRERRGRGDCGQEEQEDSRKGREGDGVERYTSACPCKVLRAVGAAAKNVSAQPSHAA